MTRIVLLLFKKCRPVKAALVISADIRKCPRCLAGRCIRLHHSSASADSQSPLIRPGPASRFHRSPFLDFLSQGKRPPLLPRGRLSPSVIFKAPRRISGRENGQTARAVYTRRVESTACFVVFDITPPAPSAGMETRRLVADRSPGCQPGNSDHVSEALLRFCPPGG